VPLSHVVEHAQPNERSNLNPAHVTALVGWDRAADDLHTSILVAAVALSDVTVSACWR